jgi:hypothetical protein
MIAGTRTGHIEQLTLRTVDILKVAFVGNGFDAFLQRYDFIVTGHHHNGTELQPLCEVHGTYRHEPWGDFDMFIQYAVFDSRQLRSFRRPCDLGCRTNKQRDLLRLKAFLGKLA